MIQKGLEVKYASGCSKCDYSAVPPDGDTKHEVTGIGSGTWVLEGHGQLGSVRRRT